MNGDDDQAVAAAELRRRLNDALARSRKTKAQLAGLAGLARSTVQEAFRPGAVPSTETVAALARELALDQAVMLDLRRRAAASAVAEQPRDAGVGKPVAAWHPHDLEVHPAGRSGRDDRALPAYVERAHDQVLAEAVRGTAAGRGAMVVLVGSSSTGKTRACWEAVQPLAAQGWRLWHPYDPTRADAALADLARVGPRTVVWLNEAQHYLGDPRVGEQVAAAVHRLLTDEGRGPVLVLGTLWPEYARAYTRLPHPGGPDPHSRVRELLAGRTVPVPETFDDEALRTAAALAKAGDRHLADTLTRASGSGRITQDLAGAPELLRRYREGTAPEQALIRAAMDARRLGMGLHLPWAFLVDAAGGYLDDDVWDALDDDWAQATLDELARPGHGAHAPLRRTGRPRRRPAAVPRTGAVPPAAPAGPVYRLADYLDQHGRHERHYICPPATFWEAAADTAAPDELTVLARAALTRGRFRHAELLARRAAEADGTGALLDRGGDRDLVGAERAAWLAPDASKTLRTLGRMWIAAREYAGAGRLYFQAAEAGDAVVLVYDDEDLAERLAQQSTPDADAIIKIVLLTVMAEQWEKARDHDGAERLARDAADEGDPKVLSMLGGMRVETGDREGGERLYRQAAEAGDTTALRALAEMREQAGDHDGAEDWAQQAAASGDATALRLLAGMREQAGDHGGAERLARQAADAGDTGALLFLAGMREQAGNHDGAERLYREAADADDTDALPLLAEKLEKAGDRDGAARLYRQAADAGNSLIVLGHLARITGTDQHPASEILRYGWEPNGSVSPPW